MYKLLQQPQHLTLTALRRWSTCHGPSISALDLRTLRNWRQNLSLAVVTRTFAAATLWLRTKICPVTLHRAPEKHRSVTLSTITRAFHRSRNCTTQNTRHIQSVASVSDGDRECASCVALNHSRLFPEASQLEARLPIVYLFTRWCRWVAGIGH